MTLHFCRGLYIPKGIEGTLNFKTCVEGNHGHWYFDESKCIILIKLKNCLLIFSAFVDKSCN
uniref:Uncharacterized protein n=1 Tax=Anguilla anguilla TaxID=7936 RepID=A0A0E9XK17_ANGAN